MIIHAKSLLPFINSTNGPKLAEEFSPRISRDEGKFNDLSPTLGFHKKKGKKTFFLFFFLSHPPPLLPTGLIRDPDPPFLDLSGIGGGNSLEGEKTRPENSGNGNAKTEIKGKL